MSKTKVRQLHLPTGKTKYGRNYKLKPTVLGVRAALYRDQYLTLQARKNSTPVSS